MDGVSSGPTRWVRSIILGSRALIDDGALQNTIEDLYNLMLADGSSTFDVADNTRIGRLALQQDRNAWISALGGSNDDAGVSAEIRWVVAEILKVGPPRHACSGSSSRCGRSGTTGSTAGRTRLRTT